MRIDRALVCLTLAAALAGGAPRPAPAEDDADVVVRKWLVLAPVDVVARRTLRPDAVFAKYLLDRTSAAPKEGEEITGTLGKPAKWALAEPDKDGDVEADNGAWAYASVESPAERVVLAKLEGAATLFVNGAGFTGDVYRLGDVGVPVALRKGANDVWVAGPRGGFRLTFVTPRRDPKDPWCIVLPPGTVVDPKRFVLPDWLEGEVEPQRHLSLRALNATTAWDYRPDDPPDRPSIVPLGVFHIRASVFEGSAEFDRKVKRGEPYRRTFVSSIDRSAQSYALVPPSPSDIDKSKIGLVLSLHGAGVDCLDQAKAYAPKPDFWIVCPTNRGRYGFDWQDWGRLDAYEVLEDALKVTGVDPRRVYLTGHSMGGHGTWHLAANDPGRFLAIAPSAGWSSFDSYGAPKVTTPLGWLWRAADGASRTLDLVDNLAQIPTYVLHGAKDDNVPLAEAQLMVDAVTKVGGKPEFHVEPGMGHWWDKDKAPGADCVDWPGIWELFRRTEPTDPEVTSLTLVEPCWSRRSDFDQPIEYGRPSRLSKHVDGVNRAASITTENVRRLVMGKPFTVMRDSVGGPSRVLDTSLVVDGKLCDSWSISRTSGSWKSDDAREPSQKHWNRMGPVKLAFANRFLLVYGTAGDDTEDAELLEKARYDSEVWAYRANGDANLMSDAQFLAGDFRDRNVIVYGNADTNSAWTAVFDDDCPIQAKRGTMTVNGTKHEGAVAAAFVRPRKGSDVALAAAFADTGAAATRLFYQFPVFSSGVGIPDYVVFGPGFLREFDGDVRAAGWFDYAWRMR